MPGFPWANASPPAAPGHRHYYGILEQQQMSSLGATRAQILIEHAIAHDRVVRGAGEHKVLPSAASCELHVLGPGTVRPVPYL